MAEFCPRCGAFSLPMTKHGSVEQRLCTGGHVQTIVRPSPAAPVKLPPRPRPFGLDPRQTPRL